MLLACQSRLDPSSQPLVSRSREGRLVTGTRGCGCRHTDASSSSNCTSTNNYSSTDFDKNDGGG